MRFAGMVPPRGGRSYRYWLERRQDYRYLEIVQNCAPARRGGIIRNRRMVEEDHLLDLVIEAPLPGVIAGDGNPDVQTDRVRLVMGLAVELPEVVESVIHRAGRRARDGETRGRVGDPAHGIGGVALASGVRRADLVIVRCGVGKIAVHEFRQSPRIHLRVIPDLSGRPVENVFRRTVRSAPGQAEGRESRIGDGQPGGCERHRHGIRHGSGIRIGAPREQAQQQDG